MANQTARNSGITGLFDLPGFSAKVQARLTAFGQKQSVQTKGRRGRGQGKWAKARAVLSSGSLVVSGKIRLDAPPLMDAWKGQEGTVTLTATATKTQAVPVRITGCQFDFDEKTHDTWDFTASCEITSTPTWTGFGTLPSATDPSASDLQLWGEGTTKTNDPSGLVTAATRTTDVWGSLPDTDSGEADRLAAIVSAALAPLPNLKLRTAVFTRDSDDGGQVVETWGLTSTADDQVLPRTTIYADVSEIGDTATTAALNGTPGSPATGSDWVRVGTDTVKLSDGNTITVYRWALRTTAAGIEQDNSPTTDDPQDLTDAATVTQVTSSGTPPATPASPVAGLKLRGVTTLKLNNVRWRHSFEFGRRNTADDLTYPRTTTTTDPNGLASAETTAALIDPGSPPATPSAPSGYKLHHTEDVKVVGGTGTVRVYHWQLVDTADEETFKHTKTATDPNDLGTEESSAAIFTTGSPPADPSLPTGLKLIGTEDVPLTAAGTTNQSVRVYRWAKRDSKDEVELGSAARPHTITHTDPDGIESYAHLTKVDASPSVPSGLVLRGTDSIPYTQGTGSDHTITKIECGTRTPKDDHEMPHTLGRVDPLGEETTRVATVATCLSSDTAAALAATAFAANKATASFAGVSVEKISRLRARTIIETAEDEGKHWHEGFRTFYDHVKGLPSDGVIGTTSAGVRVGRLPGPPILLGGYTEALLDFRQVPRETGSVWLRRRLIISSEANLTSALHLDAWGHVNSATFLGFPAKTLMYGVPRIRHLWPLIGGDHLVLVDYRWEYDNLGHFNEQMLNVGWTNTLDASTLINEIGLVVATDYFAANMQLSWPGTWDMSFALP